jgi:hypothetical protein
VLPIPADMLPSTVTLRRATRGSARGGTARTWTEEDRRASVQEMSSDDRAIHGLEEAVKGYTVFLGPPEPGVGQGDQMLVPDLGTLTVLGPAEDTNRRGVLYKLGSTGQPRRSAAPASPAAGTIDFG